MNGSEDRTLRLERVIRACLRAAPVRAERVRT